MLWMCLMGNSHLEYCYSCYYHKLHIIARGALREKIMQERGEEALAKTLKAYVEEFGKESVILELPSFMEKQAKVFNFDVKVQFMDNPNEIKVRSHSACYRLPLKDLDKKS